MKKKHAGIGSEREETTPPSQTRSQSRITGLSVFLFPRCCITLEKKAGNQPVTEYTAMPHCTGNFAWYLSKFLTGFTGMLFFYVCFLKEKEYSCLCKARMREFARDKGENTNPCTLDNQTGANVRQEGRPRFMLVVAENLSAWYAEMREWFLENDPAISETALALGKNPPKNDNVVSPENCTCCVTLLNKKSKLAESTTSVRRKRLRQHCHFRHCSGIVSAEKLLKKRRKRSCVHMHVSQDSITDFWKFCIKNMNDDSRNRTDDIKNEDTTIVDEHKDKIRKNCRCNVLSKNVKSIKTETNLEDALQENSKCANEMPSKPCTDKVDAKEEVSIDSSCNNVINKVKNYNLSCTSKQVSTQDITDSQTVNKICDGTMKCEVRTASDEELIKVIDSNKYDCSPKESRKGSQSESSFTDTLLTDNCMDLILYRELREKRAPKTNKKTVPVRLKSSRSIESKLSLKARNIKLQKYSDVDNKTRKNCFVKENNQPSLEYSAINRSSTSGSQKEGIRDEFETRSTYSDACPASKENQKNFRGNCPCDPKSRDRTQSSFNPKISQQRCKTFCENSQRQTSNFSGDNAKLKRIIDTMFDRKSTLVSEKCFAKCKMSFPQNKKKVTANTIKDQKYEDSTDSSSTVSSASSDSEDRIAFRSPYKSTMHDQCTHDRSSPTDLSWRRCPSCTVLFEHSACHKREPISNVNKWRRRDQRRRGSPTSTSSTSFVSPPVCREDCIFNRNNVDRSMRILFRKSNQNRSFRESTLYEQGTKNRMMYTDDRRVTWGFKRAY
ncbi:uncharacterized protein LOC143210884 isoform X2 [Lasioglossum baleicum]|uniref:uncharacterized protein LOC143210884 isoform X2 n=1 Tax=Lasioglossum baleicum TaxID=434251 RepID=UPI003FCD5E60